MNPAAADDFLARVRAPNPLGRNGTLTEIGDVLVFLLSDAARYVSGSTIVADGGFLAVKSF
jgi:3-oxoacyl-[acyl-carrier protein] reductase